MITLLMLLLLITPFTVQEQVSSATSPPVEVLDLEVLAREFKPRRVPDSRTGPPSGPIITRDDIPGSRKERSRTERPTIESRSIELNGIGRRSAQQQSRPPADMQTMSRFQYEYRARIRNTSPKKIRAIVWEYQFTDASGEAIISELLFRCAGSVKASDIKVLTGTTMSPPSRVVSADDQSQKQKAVINQVEYSDGSTWVRDGWKQDAGARLYYCTIGSP